MQNVVGYSPAKIWTIADQVFRFIHLVSKPCRREPAKGVQRIG